MKTLLMILVLLCVACGAEFQGTGPDDVGEAGASVGSAGSSSAGAGVGGSSTAGSSGAPNAGTGNVAGGSAGSASGGSGGDLGAGGLPSQCESPYLAELIEAATDALPDTFIWRDFATSEFDGTCYRQTVCRNEPCGTCSLTWGEPQALPDGSKVYVDFTGSCSEILAKNVCESADFNCAMNMVGSGTLTIYLQPPSRDGDALTWNVSATEVNGEWTDPFAYCTYDHEGAASVDLVEELDLSLDTLSMAASCG